MHVGRLLERIIIPGRAHRSIIISLTMVLAFFLHFFFLAFLSWSLGCRSISWCTSKSKDDGGALRFPAIIT